MCKKVLILNGLYKFCVAGSKVSPDGAEENYSIDGKLRHSIPVIELREIQRKGAALLNINEGIEHHTSSNRCGEKGSGSKSLVADGNHKHYSGSHPSNIVDNTD